MDLTITPPVDYREVAHARWTWVDPDCNRCHGSGILWINVWDRRINEYAPLYREDNDCDCVWTPEQDVLEALDEQYRSWGNPDRARDAWEGIAGALGPRRPGGWYWCGYWRTGYTVISTDYTFYDGDPASPSWQITVQWDDGRRSTHCTAWDSRRDSCHRPSARHPGPAPVPPELRFAPPARPARWSLWPVLTSCRRPHR